MPDAIASRLRLLLNAQKWNRPALNDALTSAAPVVPSGADLQVELLITKDGAALFDYTNCASVTIELSTRISPLKNNVIFSTTIAVANITTAASLVNFQGGTAQAILTVIPNAYTQLGLNLSSTQYTLAIFATSIDATPQQEPLLVQDITVVDAGLPIGNPSLPISFKAGSKLDFVCSDAKTRSVTFFVMGNGRWTLDIEQAGHNGAGQNAYSIFCSDGQWRDLTVILAQGAWTIDVAQNGHS